MAKMRKLLVIGIGLGLAGCAIVTPAPIATAPRISSIEAFGTLADARDPIDMASAPILTHLASYRHRTANLLRKQSIGIDAGKRAQACADHVRALVENGIATRNRRCVDLARDRINQCESLLVGER